MIEDLKLDENTSGLVHSRVLIFLLPAEGRDLLNHRTAAAGTTDVQWSRLRLDNILTNQNIGVEQIQKKVEHSQAQFSAECYIGLCVLINLIY